MNFNDEMKIPYVSKELCVYLREVYSLPNVIHALEACNAVENADMSMGFLAGINSIVERLEAIQAQQEEDNGIH
jgi:hypothetical protein